jgi:pyruvate/2-oxoglutarate dehydrogenase complex dihydrolipoamide acyltransferase (E2) component
MVEVDMSQPTNLRDRMRDAGTHVTFTHILTFVVAAVLTKKPGLHRLVAGNRRLLPNTVDICVSIAGDNAVTPVLIVKDAGRKSLQTIADEFRDRAVEARAEDENRLALLRKWGWIVPFGFLRRSLIRSLLNQPWYRRQASGTFQLTVVPSVDLFVPFLFNTAAALSAGRIQDRAVARNGGIEIRPMLQLACCFNHKTWNGMDTANFLNAVKSELECAENLTAPEA